MARAGAGAATFSGSPQIPPCGLEYNADGTRSRRGVPRPLAQGRGAWGFRPLGDPEPPSTKIGLRGYLRKADFISRFISMAGALRVM